LGGVAALAAGLGIAAMPAVSYSARAKQASSGKPPWLCSTEASNCGTVHAVVWVRGGKRDQGRRRLEPDFPVQITTQPTNGGVRTFHSRSHTVELTPGTYRVAAATRNSTRAQVTVSAGQTQEVTLTAIVTRAGSAGSLGNETAWGSTRWPRGAERPVLARSTSVKAAALFLTG
jgi:hypothetical protein